MKKQSTQRRISLEGKLRTGAELLELLMNYLVFICAVTTASGILGAVDSPLWYCFIPFALPFYYWFLRRRIGHVAVFVLLHMPAAVLTCAAGFALKDHRILWIILLIAGVFLYTVNSVYVRVSEKKSESMPAGMALGLTVLEFFITAYARYERGLRILMICTLIYVFLMLLRMYLKCMTDYLLTNKNAAGAMPEQAIVELSSRNVIIQSALAVAAVGVLVTTSAADRLTQLVKNAGLLVLRGIAMLLAWIASDEQAEEEILEEVLPDVAGGVQNAMEAAGEPSWWVKFLNFLFNFCGIALGLTFLIAIIVMMVRKLIDGFYENRMVRNEVLVEGYLEEEERIGRKKETRQSIMPVLGGTPAQKVRRIFWKAVVAEYGKLGEQKPDPASTARQFAAKFSGENADEWKELAELYEKARYAQTDVTKEEQKRAAVLARKVKR